MFPDVFVYPVSRQEMQMSSFYDQAIPPVQTKLLQLKSTQKSSDHCAVQIGHSGGGVSVQAASSPSSSVFSGTPNHSHRHPVNTHVDKIPHSGGNGNGSATVPRHAPVLPPLRRVVKFTIHPHLVTIGVALCAVLNTALCFIVPVAITPPLGTQWGSFLYLWLLITAVQLVTHSVYLCTPAARFASFAHLTVVALSAVLLPRSLFALYMWIAPCLCAVVLSYQSYLFFIVYTNLQNSWVYVSAGAVFVLGPMTQLVQLDPDNSMVTPYTATLWSAISIYTLYAFALACSRKSVLVDVIVGTSPTSQLQE
jgi:hypothetical protein